MNLNSRESLIARLRKGKQRRSQFVESHLVKGVAYQIRAIRDRLGWSQEKLAGEVGMPQNVISRLESPDYGRYTLTTLRRLAAAFDVALVIRFIPFSEMLDWVSGTPRLQEGLSEETLGVASFDEEEAAGIFNSPPVPGMDVVAYRIPAIGENDRVFVMPGTSAGSVRVDGTAGSLQVVRKPVQPNDFQYRRLTACHQ